MKILILIISVFGAAPVAHAKIYPMAPGGHMLSVSGKNCCMQGHPLPEPDREQWAMPAPWPACQETQCGEFTGRTMVMDNTNALTPQCEQYDMSGFYSPENPALFFCASDADDLYPNRFWVPMSGETGQAEFFY
jgi:hypothetical protein